MWKPLLVGALAAWLGLAAAQAKEPEKDKEKDKGKVGIELSVGAPALLIAPASISLTANAWSEQANHPVVRVEYYQGTTLIGTAATPPYALTWNGLAAGTYTLTAKAYNDKGDAARSTPLPIAVDAPPSVSLTTGANQTLIAPASVTLSANASDSDGSIAKVEFYQGSTLIGTATAAPYTVTWANAPAGTYSLTARATDNQGASTTSAAVSLLVDAPPTVTLTGPAANTVFGAPASITLTANAADSDGTVTKVEFYQGSTLIGTATAAPYSVTWANAPAGTYSLTARATDNNGIASTSAAVPVIVNTPPTVSLTSPLANAAFNAPASITLSATAADSDGSITKVDFYQGSTLIGTAIAAPYSITWSNAPAGSYTLTAIVTDNSNVTTTSAPVAVRVNAAPAISISSPTANQALIAPATITLNANATDSDGTVTKVDFYQGSTLLGTATTAPYTVTWSNAPAGNYSLTAIVTDNDGATSSSAPASLTVLPNQLPSVTLTSPTANQGFTAPASITLTASASDTDGAVASIAFYQGTTLIGTATAAPYTATWINVSEGSYSLTAKAIDNGGAETYSATVSITVTSGAPKLYYLHSDHLDTPRLVTDETNKVVWRNMPLSEPFGMSPVEEDPDGDGTKFTLNLRFPGQYFDRETNTNYNAARDYDPNTGRYLESDPIGLDGGINTYGYVNGQPLRYADPLGLCPWCGAAAGGSAGAAGVGGLGGLGGFGGAGQSQSSASGFGNGAINDALGDKGRGRIIWPPGYDPDPKPPTQCRIDVIPPSPPQPPKPSCDGAFQIRSAACRTLPGLSQVTCLAMAVVEFAICKKVFGGHD